MSDAVPNIEDQSFSLDVTRLEIEEKKIEKEEVKHVKIVVEEKKEERPRLNK